MTKYASDLPDFSDLLRLTAAWKEMPAAIIEKDYFLTRALCALAMAHNGQFILKGGTSLSKGWHLLQRFSEDIDILVRSEDKWGKAAKHGRMRQLAKTIAETDGFTNGQVRESEEGVHRTVVFIYPSVTKDSSGLSRTVMLEMGYRGQANAAVKQPVQSMVAEFAAANGQSAVADDLKPFDLEMQDLCRTFVEKLFAAYAAYEKNRAAQGARHYYDLYELCQVGQVRSFAGTGHYKQAFAEVKDFTSHAFRDSPVPQADCFSGCSAFQPKGSDISVLEGNYRREAELFFKGQPPLSEVLAKIGELLPNL